jgi:hypothetical protein
MSRLTKNPQVPVELMAAIPKADRLLAWAAYRDGLIAVTDNNFVDTGELNPTLIPWSIALQARWEPPMLTLVTQVDSQSVAATQTWTLAEPGKIPSSVRDRVTHTVVVDKAYNLPNAGNVRFVARRDGESVTWITVVDDLAPTQSAAGARDVAAALSELKSIFGI